MRCCCCCFLYFENLLRQQNGINKFECQHFDFMLIQMWLSTSMSFVWMQMVNFMQILFLILLTLIICQRNGNYILLIHVFDRVSSLWHNLFTFWNECWDSFHILQPASKLSEQYSLNTKLYWVKWWGVVGSGTCHNVKEREYAVAEKRWGHSLNTLHAILWLQINCYHQYFFFAVNAWCRHLFEKRPTHFIRVSFGPFSFTNVAKWRNGIRSKTSPCIAAYAIFLADERQGERDWQGSKCDLVTLPFWSCSPLHSQLLFERLTFYSVGTLICHQLEMEWS